MSEVSIDPVCRRRIQPRYYCRNGQLVSAQFQQEVSTTLNQVARHRTKEYFRSGGDVTSIESPKVWRFAGHIGPLAGAMIARVVIAPADMATSTNNPYVGLTLYNTSGTQIAHRTAHFGYQYGLVPSVIPDEWCMATIVIDTSTLQDTSFRAVLQGNEEARPISCTVAEYSARPDTDNGYVNQMYSVGQSILDEDRKANQDLAHAIHKRGPGPLFMFSSATDAIAPNTFSASYTNIMQVHFAGNADKAGFMPDLRYCNRKTKTTIPVKIECYAGMSAGGGVTGNVRVIDGAGNTYATFVVTGSAAWQTPVTANLPNDLRMYYIEHKGDGVNTITTYAVDCYRYMA